MARTLPSGISDAFEMARVLQSEISESRMATRVNMIKLLQETRALADLTNRRPPPKYPGTLALQVRPQRARHGTARPKKTITILMQDLPDIPHPVKITHRRPEVARS